jgi:cytochrome c-type biogenesis protein CcmF
MLAEFGFGVLLLTFFVALFSIGVAVYGHFKNSPQWVESARRALQLTFPLITLVALALIYELATGHFELQYVFSVTSREMPAYLKITALWGGQAGSLIFWSWLMSAFATAVTFRKWERDREFLPWVVVVIGVTLAFFLSLSLFFENPFVRWWQTSSGGLVQSLFPPAGAILFTPPDGQGLNELLRHPGMVFHPPMLYTGFVAFVIPYAFAMAALITGRVDDRWIRLTRRWTLVAWMFLSIGLVLGMWWAYDVLGWGGYWGWDSSEVAAAIPWLIATPFLHTIIIQEKRQMFKQLNMILIILTYVMVIVGTFLIRSGLLSSVHAFAQSKIGYQFLVFIGVMLLVSVFLLVRRWKDLRSPASFAATSMLSKEALTLLATLIFGGLFIVFFWGIFFPIISEVVTGTKITVGPEWYKHAVGPLFATILLLMGVAPLSSWTYGTIKTIGRAAWKPIIPAALTVTLLFVFGVHNLWALLGLGLVAYALFVTLFEFWRGTVARSRSQGEGILTALWNLVTRNRRRYGGYIVHIAMVMMALAIIGVELFQKTTQQTLAIGQSIELSGYTVRYDSLAQFPYVDGRIVTRAVMSVYRDGKRLGELYPRYDYYADGQPMTIPAVRSTLADDLYIVLVNWENNSAAQTPFKVYHNPLVIWLWLGAFVLVGGTMVASWPERDLVTAWESERAKTAAAAAD